MQHMSSSIAHILSFQEMLHIWTMTCPKQSLTNTSVVPWPGTKEQASYSDRLCCNIWKQVAQTSVFLQGDLLAIVHYRYIQHSVHTKGATTYTYNIINVTQGNSSYLLNSHNNQTKTVVKNCDNDKDHWITLTTNGLSYLLKSKVGNWLSDKATYWAVHRDSGLDS